MTDTINDVPRELLAELQEHIDCHRDAVLWGKVCDLLSAPSPTDHVEDVRAMVDAPSPAGVDGCKGKNCGATDGVSHSDECIAEHEQACGRADLNGLPVVAYLIGGEPSLTPCPVCGVVNEPLCRLSDATAIIDGLRGEVERLGSQKAEWVERATALGQKADQQAQRIGELEGFLRSCLPALSDGGCAALANRIAATLSAGKEGE